MSQTSPIGNFATATANSGRGAIARASRAIRVDFDYPLTQAKIEPRLNRNASAGTSSAAGFANDNESAPTGVPRGGAEAPGPYTAHFAGVAQVPSGLQDHPAHSTSEARSVARVADLIRRKASAGALDFFRTANAKLQGLNP